MEALGLAFTQAEMIAALTFFGGAVLWYVLGRSKGKTKS
jgi:hypothetical protein